MPTRTEQPEHKRKLSTVYRWYDTYQVPGIRYRLSMYGSTGTYLYKHKYIEKYDTYQVRVMLQQLLTL